jgi:DNA-binding response OmpR family regulator
MKVLLIEGRRETADSLKKLLEHQFIVETALCGTEGECLAQFDCFDLILLATILPDMHGADLAVRLRAQNIHADILFLTTPFSFPTLLARMSTLGQICLGELTVNPANMTVSRNGSAIALRRKEYFILEYLVRNAGKVVTRQALLERVWETQEETSSNVVDVHIKYLRDKIDKQFDRKLIKTVYGMGYKIDT